MNDAVQCPRLNIESLNSCIIDGTQNSWCYEPTKELAALKYALTKETRLVLNTISSRGQQGWPSPEYKKKWKTIMREKRMWCMKEWSLIKWSVPRERAKTFSWQTRCRQQGGKCEFCDQCTPELIRDRFIVVSLTELWLRNHKMTLSAI